MYICPLNKGIKSPLPWLVLEPIQTCLGASMTLRMCLHLMYMHKQPTTTQLLNYVVSMIFITFCDMYIIYYEAQNNLS